MIQLFNNLISNAAKYRSDKPLKIQISAQEEAGEWKFKVQDNGIGIAPAYHQKIFGIFQRLHSRSQYAGTGIGLAICAKIIENHKGKIWVESEKDQGSQFIFTIPKKAN